MIEGLQPNAPAFALRGLGLLSFFVSDLFVIRHRVVQPNVVNKLAGLPAYFGAQHALALSLAYPLNGPEG